MVGRVERTGRDKARCMDCTSRLFPFGFFQGKVLWLEGLG